MKRETGENPVQSRCCMPFILTMTTRRCDDTLGNRPLLPRFAEEEVGRRSEKGEARRPAAV